MNRDGDGCDRCNSRGYLNAHWDLFLILPDAEQSLQRRRDCLLFIPRSPSQVSCRHPELLWWRVVTLIFGAIHM
jgi:hypothetical protein